jgi:hypothetical protein
MPFLYLIGDKMTRDVVFQAIVTVGVVITLFYVLFNYFGLNWFWAAILSFIIGEILVLVPLYLLFFKELIGK